MQGDYYPRPRRAKLSGPFLDFYLPWALVLIFYVPVLGFAFYEAVTSSAPLASLLSLALMFVLFLYVILPTAAVGLRLGLRASHAELVEDARFKILAAYCPTPAATVGAVALFSGAVMRMAQPGVGGILAVFLFTVVGALVGFSVSFFLMWLLFHLKFTEALVGWIFTSIFYFLGTLSAFGTLFTILVPLGYVSHRYGGSSVAATPVEPMAPRPAESRASQGDPLFPRGGPFALPENDPRVMRTNRSAPQETPGANVSIPPPLVPPVSAPSQRTIVTPPPPQVAYVPPSRTNVPTVPPPSIVRERSKSDPVGQFQEQKSSLVAGVSAVDFGGKVRQVLRGRGPVVLAIKDDEPGVDVIEAWDVLTKQKIGQTSFPRETALEAQLFLSPDATAVARIVRFPRLGVRVASLQGLGDKISIPLNERFGTPTLEGFLTADKLAVHWRRLNEEGMEIWDTTKGKSLKQMPVMHARESEGNGAVSADGRYYVMSVSPPRGRPQVQVYELLSPRGGTRWSPLNVDAALAEDPAGMAFSPDGKKFAALYERGGQAAVFCWSVTDGKLLKPREIPIPTKPASRGKRRGIEWIAGGNAWLVMGDTIVDVESGEVKGSLNAPESADRWAIDARTLAYRFDAGGTAQFATVTIDSGKLGGIRPH